MNGPTVGGAQPHKRSIVRAIGIFAEELTMLGIDLGFTEFSIETPQWAGFVAAVKADQEYNLNERASFPIDLDVQWDEDNAEVTIHGLTFVELAEPLDLSKAFSEQDDTVIGIWIDEAADLAPEAWKPQPHTLRQARAILDANEIDLTPGPLMVYNPTDGSIKTLDGSPLPNLPMALHANVSDTIIYESPDGSVCLVADDKNMPCIIERVGSGFTRRLASFQRTTAVYGTIVVDPAVPVHRFTSAAGWKRLQPKTAADIDRETLGDNPVRIDVAQSIGELSAKILEDVAQKRAEKPYADAFDIAKSMIESG